MHHLVEIWHRLLESGYHWMSGDGGYLAIIVLMALESSIVPVPSEIVIPPAAFLAARDHRLNFYGVIAAGTVGSYIGSAISYWIALAVGRPLIARYGKYFLLSEEKITRAETWLVKYEAGGIFFARLLPVIRHLISIPAGLVRMNFTTFSVMTIVGAAIWCTVLAYLGDHAYRVVQAHPEFANGAEGIEKFVKHQSISIVLIVVVLAALYFLMLKLSSKKNDSV